MGDPLPLGGAVGPVGRVAVFARVPEEYDLPLVPELPPVAGLFGFVLTGGPLGPVLVETWAGFERAGGRVGGGWLEPLGALLELEPEE